MGYQQIFTLNICINIANTSLNSKIDHSFLPGEELSSDEIETWIPLKTNFYGWRVGGVQPSTLHQSIKNESVPRFQSVRQLFVQIINAGDHSICATNMFGDSSNDVYLYDSFFTSVSDSTITQVLSLLHEDCSTDNLLFHVQVFKQQRIESRTCGFYATAAALSCCLKIDPTGHVYNETLLVSHFNKSLNNGKLVNFPTVAHKRKSEALFHTKKNIAFVRAYHQDKCCSAVLFNAFTGFLLAASELMTRTY